MTPDHPGMEAFGYSEHWAGLFEPYASSGCVPGRVIRSDRGSVLLASPHGIARAKPGARLLKAAAGPAALPAVGDWVAAHVDDGLEVPLIEAVLPRTSAITRGNPGRTSEVQVMAANIDVVFVVHPIAGPPNLRRLERELSLSWESGAIPVVVLTKADLSSDVEGARAAAETIAFGAEVVVTSALTAEGLEPLLRHVSCHRTAVLIGPSGAGKSTLINGLLGEQRQATREVRVSDGRGRHTTVARELIQMPGGGVLVDTPGLRALGLTGSEEGISSAFPDIEQVAGSCRFGDCTHEHEPGCAVRSAVESGALPADRLASYQKLMREAQVAAAKTDVRGRAEEHRRDRVFGKAAKDYDKRWGRGQK
ncbi:MAG: ribosome small subunit-dependent GTPase A [Actinomycetes bacterium]